MMNLRLNLLSPEKKARFISIARFLFIKELLEIIIFTASLLAIFYMIGWLVLADALNDLVNSTLLINRESPSVNREVRQINKLASDIILSGSEYAPLTPRLLELVQALPPNIKLSAINIDRKNNSFILTGTAQTRSAVLNYQNVLAKISWLEDVTTPVSQLFQKENVNFEVRAKLKGFPLTQQPAPKKPARPSSRD